MDNALGEAQYYECCVVDLYERSRTHLSLAKDTPISRPIMGDGLVVTFPEVGGLHHRYERRAA
jgi:putative transposase